MRLTIPAVAGSALLALAIASTSQAATAHVSPLIDTGTVAAGSVAIALRHTDDCRFKTAFALFTGNETFDDVFGPSWQTPVKTVNGCRPGYSTIWEDGSVSTAMGVRLPTAMLARGQAYLSVAVWTRTRPGARWARHIYVRSFWHTPAAEMPVAHIAAVRPEDRVI